MGIAAQFVNLVLERADFGEGASRHRVLIREHNRIGKKNADVTPFSPDQIEALGDFCKARNSNFNRERWRGYIAGECGPGGGALKA